MAKNRLIDSINNAIFGRLATGVEIPGAWAPHHRGIARDLDKLLADEENQQHEQHRQLEFGYP